PTSPPTARLLLRLLAPFQMHTSRKGTNNPPPMSELNLKFYLLLNPRGSQIPLGNGAVADIIPTSQLAGMIRAVVAVTDDFPKSKLAAYGSVSRELTLEEYNSYTEKKTAQGSQFVSPIGP